MVTQPFSQSLTLSDSFWLFFFFLFFSFTHLPVLSVSQFFFFPPFNLFYICQHWSTIPLLSCTHSLSLSLCNFLTPSLFVSVHLSNNQRAWMSSYILNHTLAPCSVSLKSDDPLSHCWLNSDWSNKAILFPLLFRNYQSWECVLVSV